MRVYGQLEYAQLEQVVGIGALLGATTAGRIVCDTTTATSIQPLFYDGTAWRKLSTLGGSLGAIVNSDISASAAISPSKISARQVVIGTPQTSTGTNASSTFADITNQPSVSFTASYSGKYKIFISPPAESIATFVLRINNSVGSATINFSQESVNQSGSTSSITLSLFLIATLTAGTAYTFTLQGKSSGAATLNITSGSVTNGVAMIAEQIE